MERNIDSPYVEGIKWVRDAMRSKINPNQTVMRRLLPSIAVALLTIFPAGCGKSGTQEQSSNISKKWEFKTGGAVTGALALGDDGTLYVASEDGFVYALDVSGNLQWKFNAGPMVSAPSVGADGTIYVTNREHRIYAINHSGTQQWATGGGPYANKQSWWRGGAVDQNFYYTPWRGVVRAVRLTTGALDWSAGYGFEDEGSISILPNGLIAYAGPGRVDAVDSSGRTVWNYPVMDPPMSVELLEKNNGRIPVGNFWVHSGIAVGSDGTLFAATNGPSFVAISPDGHLKLEFSAKSRSINRATPVIASDGTIYFACADGYLYAFNSDGSPKWELKTSSSITATPVLAEDGTLYVLNEAALLAVSPEGKLIASVAFGGGRSSPTLAPDGTLYVSSHAGTIAAFSTTHGPLMNSPWPKFQHDLANSGRAPQW